MPATVLEPPYYPIVYVRGYAGSQGEVEETAADPYNGFNIGSTKHRQIWTGRLDRFFFESPLIRLMKEWEYRDVYDAGEVMPLHVALRPRSVIVYRYYDDVSTQLGTGERGEIEDYARGLGRLILSIRDRLCEGDAAAEEAFRVHLVAHSMGGLVCRCFLQNEGLGQDAAETAALRGARQAVDKVFTYATPHNGIDMHLIGNVPGFFTRNNADDFNRDRMRKYLGLPAGNQGDEEDVASLNGKFDPDRFFCLVGTNHRDYEAAGGLSRRLVGPMSDGLVRIVNAAAYGSAAGANGAKQRCPRAFVHRSHSGHYGIVNSEDGYQNLVRFLFGDVRVDGVLEVLDLTLPPDVDREFKNGRPIRASYHFEVTVRVRGGRWELHRRVVDEGSAIFRTFDDMLRPANAGLNNPRHPHLFSAFLSLRSRVNPRSPSLGFSIDLGVLVPEYEVDGRLWNKNRYEGGYLYRDKINLEVVAPAQNGDPWRLRYGFDSNTPNRTTQTLEAPVDPKAATAAGAAPPVAFRIPVQSTTRPGLKAELVLTARPWN